MSEYFGPGVTRTLSALRRQFTTVIWRKGKPPLDSEFNLVSQIGEEARRELLQSQTPSGWLTDPLNPRLDYRFDPQASNMFWLGGPDPSDAAWAVVNGWVVPVTGTLWEADARAAIKLPPPSAPPSEGDVNFVFLEVWEARLQSTGSLNKPSPGALWPWGNVEYGAADLLPNDLQDPAQLVQTSDRVQVQYRIRVVRNVNPAVFQFGFNAAIRAQGPLSAEVASVSPLYNFTNMREELGDAGLWRAGDGNGLSGALGTVDGYVYAVPIAFVFRRTTGTWGTLTGQHQAAPSRNLLMTDRLQASVLPQVRLTAPVSPTALSLTVSADRLDTTFPASGILALEDELVKYSGWTGTTITLTERGSRRSQATSHPVDAKVNFVSGHPLGLFSDQVVAEDVYDLRHGVQLRGWDHQALLRANLARVMEGTSASAWKRNEALQKGTRLFQVDYVAQAPAPDGMLTADAPDGFRRVFSDAAALQPDNLAVLPFDASTSSTADWAANPAATILRTQANAWGAGDIAIIPLAQFRATFKSADDKRVRFVHPLEYVDFTAPTVAKHRPVRVWFGSTDPDSPTAYLTRPLTDRSNPSVFGGQTPFFVFGSKPSPLPGVVPAQGSGLINFTAPDTLTVAGVDFSTPSSVPGFATVADQLAGSWFIAGDVPAPTTFPQNHGAWQILGSDGGTGLQVNTTLQPFVTGSISRQWYLRNETCTEDDDELIVVLTATNGGAPYVTGQPLYLSYDLMYHPSAGLARCPEDGLFVRTTTLNEATSRFLRELNVADVAGPSDAPTVRDYPVVPFSAYAHRELELQYQDRLARNAAAGVEPVWAEAYVDRASKTLLFQPVRRVPLTLSARPLLSVPSWASDIQIPEFSAGLTLGNRSFLLPREVVPHLGRQELPFRQTQTALVTDPPAGLNHVLQLSGGDNSAAAGPNAKLMLPRVLLAYVRGSAAPAGSYLSLSAYGVTPPVLTSALKISYYSARGVRGLALPAHYGVARLFGVYRASDFASTGSPWQAPDYRVVTGTTENLLRRDAEFRSLFLDPATGQYVIPEASVDLARLGSALADADLVIEAALFMFDQWPTSLEGGDFLRIICPALGGANPEDPVTGLASLSLLVNTPASSPDQMAVVSTRRPYQGSPQGTMPVSVVDDNNLDPTDYLPKRSAETPTQVVALREPLSADTVRTLNPAALEVLAVEVRAVSRGTGALSGPVLSGALTDVGYLSQAAYPFADLTSSPRRVFSRAHVLEADPTTDSTGRATVRFFPEQEGALTERLPMGLALQDAHFLGEPLGPGSSYVWELTAGSGQAGHLDRRLMDQPGLGARVLVFSDGTTLGASPAIGYNANLDLFRTYRGGTVMTDAGTPVAYHANRVTKQIDWLNANSERRERAIHGGVMLVVAMLVRTRPETATAQSYVTSNGDELQMLILTGSALGREQLLGSSNFQVKEFLDLFLQLHPTGLGEGWSAAERFRLEGRPLEKGAREILPNGFVTVTGDDNGSTPPPAPDPCSCP